LKKIISVVGARPNFIKVAPLHRAFLKHEKQLQHLICHTGQHYDVNMSEIFFEELELAKPNFYLGVGSGSHAEQTAKIMIEFEKVLLKEKPNLIIVVGDVNSTAACSLVAVKLGIKVAHVEAGLRSFDRTMPEEINRILTDAIADYLFVTEESGIQNLKNEGIDKGKIFFVGNCMIDSLIHYLPKIEKSDIVSRINLEPKKYIVVTLHRPNNVDEPSNLKEIFLQFFRLAESYKIVFPIHPRTQKVLEIAGLTGIHKNILLIDPIGYIDFVSLVKNCALTLTDSGGIQEETTFLKVPCLTLRDNTERPITTILGTNKLIGTNYNNIYNEAASALQNIRTNSTIPPLWDGNAAERIAGIILSVNS
jgi:UDP-N-acetylglucosamine 2-epimerase (non-hydrolysing)